MKKLILDVAALVLQLTLFGMPVLVVWITELRAENSALRELERILYMRTSDDFSELLKRWRDEKERMAKRASNKAFILFCIAAFLELLFVMNYFSIGRAAGY